MSVFARNSNRHVFPTAKQQRARSFALIKRILKIPTRGFGNQDMNSALREIHGRHPMPDDLVDNPPILVAATHERDLQTDAIRHSFGVLAFHATALVLELEPYIAPRAGKAITASPPLRATRAQDHPERVSDA